MAAELTEERMEELEKEPTFDELMDQHNWRFKFMTSRGEVVLKRISYLDHQQIRIEICREDPEYAEALEKLADYNEVARNQIALHEAWEKGGKKGIEPVEFPEAYKADRYRVRATIAQYNFRNFAPCFEKPVIKSKLELDTFIDNLQEEERSMVVKTLSTLILGINDPDKNLVILGISKKYGIKFSQDLLVGKMTRQQMELFMVAEAREAEEIKDMLKGMVPK
jgi:hypothetical protein